MADSTKNSTNNKELWSDPAGSEKHERRERLLSIRSSLLTLLLTTVIIVGGFMLPTLLYPFLDSYRGRMTQLPSPSVDIISGHVFEEPVTLYPWDIYDEAQVRHLTSFEMSFMEESGVTDFLISNMQLRGMQLERDYSLYTQRILVDFRYLEPLDATEPGCFVLVDADINLDGEPDVRCAVDSTGKIISLLFVSDTWSALQLTDPIEVLLDEALGKEREEANKTSDANDAGTSGDAGNAGDAGNTADLTEDASDAANNNNTDDPAANNPPENNPAGNAAAPANTPTGPDDIATPPETQVSFRPHQEEENIWLFAYAISREALNVGQMNVYSIFRQLDMSFEERFGYSFYNLIPAPPEFSETLPELEPMTINIDVLPTGNYLLTVYDFSDGTRLILYINSSTQNCDGFTLSTMPLA
ncbi:MAG: hypothetical protein FWD27_04735 [Coriobacteriia bacterium]|nr:hypothetical protein [Coriobacteriia bacterium]